MSTHPLEKILHPKSIAVVGASGRSDRWGGSFVKPLLALGFKGAIYPVNPKYPEMNGIKAYPSVRDIPGPVDYVISSLPARLVPELLEDCSYKGVKTVHIFTARFSETGRQDAINLEKKILKQARELGIRIIGPNCMGIYHPRQGMSWSDTFPKKSGGAGLAAQSGNVAGDIIQVAASRGVYFSKAVSYGNAIDFNESDYLDYFSQDPETKLVIMYIEGVRDGKRFFNVLRRAALSKPVIIIKSGRGKSGARTVASHTASLAGSSEIWEAMITQAGAISAGSLDEVIDLAVSFYFLPKITGRRIGIATGAGGASALAADHCEDMGFDVVPLPVEIREELKEKGIPIWDWIGNPVDMSIIMENSFPIGAMLEMMAENQNFDLLIALMRSPNRGRQPDLTLKKYLATYELKKVSQKPLLAVLEDRHLGYTEDDNWSKNMMVEVRAKLTAARIPYYQTAERAAKAVSKLIDYYQRGG
ncbi:acetate--CoA ligase family protein [Chloroflexota bacterium]